MTATLSAYADLQQRETTYRLLRQARQARDLYRAACGTDYEPLKAYRRDEFVMAQSAADSARRALYGTAL